MELETIACLSAGGAVLGGLYLAWLKLDDYRQIKLKNYIIKYGN